MARILILRQLADAEETAALVAARGHLPLILPLHETILLGGSPPPEPIGGFAGFAVTSRNAVPALARHFSRDPRPVLCVGDGTAEAARDAGFPAVEAGEGTAEGLGRMARRFGGDLPLLYVAGRVRTGTLEAALDAAGVPFVLWETYDTRPLRPDAEAVHDAVGAAPDAVLLLSAAQAGAFAELCRTVPALLAPPPLLLCLSERIARELPLELRALAAISQTPRLSSLFDRLP